MKITRIHVFLTSIVTLLLIALYPLAKILLQIKNIQNLYLSFGVIFYLLFMIIMCILDILLVIYFVRYIAKHDIKNKALWIILIILFNILIIPYFYMKYIEKEEHIVFNTLLYAIPLAIYLFSFGFGLYTFNELNTKKIEKQKIIDSTKNIYTTKDGKVTFTFGYGYKDKEVGEYDLYAINSDKSIVFSAFTYNTIDYEQKTIEEYLNKGIEDLKKGKESFELYSKEKLIAGDNYSITTVSYEGTAEIKTSKKVATSNCIYKLSVISFNDEPNYYVYVIEVVTKANYDTYKKELLDILQTVSLKKN